MTSGDMGFSGGIRRSKRCKHQEIGIQISIDESGEVWYMKEIWTRVSPEE